MNVSLIRILLSIWLVLAASAGLALSVSSSSIVPDQLLDPAFTCDGINQSPALDFQSTNPKVVSYAFILSDPDAPGGVFYHWAFYNVPKTTSHLDQGQTPLPSPGQMVLTSWGKASYQGPCPPTGALHHYVFTMYGVDSLLQLPASGTVADLLRALQGHIVDQGSLTATYKH